MASIVAVEDDPDIHLLIKILLEDAGHQVRMAVTGEEGLALLDEQLPDLVLLDVALPGDLDGLDVVRRLRGTEGTQGVRVLMLTARAREADVQTGLSAGADDYLLKPFDIAVLMGRIESLLS